MRRNNILISVVLVMLFVMPCASVAITPNQILNYEQRMLNYREDLIDIGKNINGLDQEITINIIAVATEHTIILTNIYDILLIKSLVKNPDDINRIKPVINKNFYNVVDNINLSVEKINISLSKLHNQAVIAIATKIKDDLRELKELLQKNE